MSGNTAYSSHFLSSWVAQCDEDAEPSRPSTPTQPPEQTPLPTSSLTPSSPSNATSMSPQYLPYFPTSWVLTSSSSPSPSPSPSSFPNPLLPMSNPTSPSAISPKMPKPQETPDFSTLGSHSSLHIPHRPEGIERNYSIFSQTTLRPDSMALSPTSRTNSWHCPTKLQNPLVQRHDADWIKAAEKRITVQLSPFLGQGRQAGQSERDLIRQSQQTLLQNATSWMHPQQDLPGLDIKNTDCKVDHVTDDNVDYVERIGEDDSDEGSGDIPHRAPSVSMTYSARASSIQ